MSQPRPPVVVLSSIDWDAAWQRHQIFAAQFAERGHKVLFVENTGLRAPRLGDLGRIVARIAALLATKPKTRVNAVPEGLTIITPLMLPPSNAMFRWLNSLIFIPRLARRLKGEAPRPLVVAYMPSATTLSLAKNLDASKIIYDCASNFRALPGAPADLADTEKELLALADLVVCDSDYLFAQKKAEHGNVVQIHQGVSEAFFAAKPAAGLRRFASYGTWVSDLDPALLIALADGGFSVAVSGFLKAPPPEDPRVEVLPPAPREELVRRLESFDGFLLPHKLNDFMLGVVPAKIYECLAMGRPVLATPLPSLRPLAEQGLIYMGAAPQDWLRIARDLPRTETPELRERRVALAREHTHAREFDRLLEAVRKL